MKKTLAIAAVVAMVPFAAHAKSAISDADLGSVTGQAGVSVSLDLNMNVSMDALAWGDADGIKATTQGGWVGMKNFNISNMHIGMRTDYVGAGTAHSLGTDGIGGWTDLQAFSIDVATADGTTTGALANANNPYATGKTFVRIGLGTLELGIAQMKFDAALGSDYAGVMGGGSLKAALTQTMGSVEMDAFDMKLGRGGYVDIMAMAGQGVAFGLNVAIDTMHIGTLSWGNANGVSGLAGANAAGYVGLANFNASGITIQGTVGIQVATDTATGTNPATDYIPGTIGYVNQVALGGTAPSFVHIQLGDGAYPNGANSSDYSDTTSHGVTFGMARMTTDVAVGSAARLDNGAGALSAGTKAYGTVALENLKFKVQGFVDIGAHNSADPNTY